MFATLLHVRHQSDIRTFVVDCRIPAEIVFSQLTVGMFLLKDLTTLPNVFMWNTKCHAARTTETIRNFVTTMYYSLDTALPCTARNLLKIIGRHAMHNAKWISCVTT